MGGHLDHVVALRRRSPDRPAGERPVGVDTDLRGLAQHGWGRGDQLARFPQKLLSALMDGLDRGGLRLQLLDARVGLELPLIRDDTGRAAHGTVRSFVSGPVDLECLSEQGRRLAGERGIGAPQPLQVVAHVAELAHRGVHPLAGYDGEGAQLPQTGQGAPLLDRDRVGRESAFHRREVPGFLAECLGDAAGALVVQAVELRQELRGLRLLVSDLALGVEPGLAEQGLGRRDLAETEDLRQGVVQLGGAPLQDPSQLVVREKGWPALQGTAPAVLLQVAPLAVDGEGGDGDVGFVRPAALDGHGRAPAVGPEPAGDAGWSVVEVAPAVLPDLGPLGPAPVGAGEQHLEGLGEGGLARAVAPHHEGQAGGGLQAERDRRADAPEALDLDGGEVGGCRRRDDPLPTHGAGFLSVEGGPEEVRPAERRKDQISGAINARWGVSEPFANHLPEGGIRHPPRSLAEGLHGQVPEPQVRAAERYWTTARRLRRLVRWFRAYMPRSARGGGRSDGEREVAASRFWRARATRALRTVGRIGGFEPPVRRCPPRPLSRLASLTVRSCRRQALCASIAYIRWM